MMETTPTAGIVRPIVGSDDPSARFRLVCRRLALAALTAARPSGSSTSPAIIIPTTDFGASMRASPNSTVGVRNLARPTTATREARRKPALRTAVVLEGGGACVSASALLHGANE